MKKERIILFPGNENAPNNYTNWGFWQVQLWVVAVAEVVHEQEIDPSRLFLQSLQENRS